MCLVNITEDNGINSFNSQDLNELIGKTIYTTSIRYI